MASSAFNLGGGNSSIDLVWEADDISSGFLVNNTTISMDLSSYDYVMAECSFNEGGLTSFSMVPVGDTSNTHLMIAADVKSEFLGHYFAEKPWYATNTGITLGAGSYRGYATAESLLPRLHRVYGIKSKNIISGKF